jgi:hypothetical protein
VQDKGSRVVADAQLPPWSPRRVVTVAQIGVADVSHEVDFAGVLIWAGDVNTCEHTGL